MAESRPTGKETVILVHGTFAAPERGRTQWYEIGHEFVSKLDQELERRGSSARCWAHAKELEGAGFQTFAWSGENSWIARSGAAQRLASEIGKLTASGWRCHVVAHSHGGNVLLDALRILDEKEHSAFNRPSWARKWTSASFVTLGTPFFAGRRDALYHSWTMKDWISLSLMSALTVLLSAALLIPYSETSWAALRHTFSVAPVGLLVFAACVGFASWVLLTLFMGIWGIGTDYSNIFDYERQDSRMLCINSNQDEAWILLNTLQHSDKPPFLDGSGGKRHGWLEYAADLVNSSLSFFAEYSRERYSIEPAWIGRVSMFSCLVLVGSCIAFAVADEGAHRIAALCVIIFWITLVGPMLTQPTYLLHSLSLPWRAIRAIFYIAKSLGVELGTLLLRRYGWTFTKILAFGMSGHPNPSLRVFQTAPSINGPVAVYYDLDEAIVREIVSTQKYLAGEGWAAVTAALSSPDLDPTKLTAWLRQIELSSSIVHSSYYAQSECISLIADWVGRSESQIWKSAEHPFDPKTCGVREWLHRESAALGSGEMQEPNP